MGAWHCRYLLCCWQWSDWMGLKRRCAFRWRPGDCGTRQGCQVAQALFPGRWAASQAIWSLSARGAWAQRKTVYGGNCLAHLTCFLKRRSPCRACPPVPIHYTTVGAAAPGSDVPPTIPFTALARLPWRYLGSEKSWPTTRLHSSWLPLSPCCPLPGGRGHVRA